MPSGMVAMPAYVTLQCNTCKRVVIVTIVILSAGIPGSVFSKRFVICNLPFKVSMVFIQTMVINKVSSPSTVLTVPGSSRRQADVPPGSGVPARSGSAAEPGQQPRQHIWPALLRDLGPDAGEKDVKLAQKLSQL